MSWTQLRCATGNGEVSVERLTHELLGRGEHRYYAKYENGVAAYIWATSLDEATNAASAFSEEVAAGALVEEVSRSGRQMVRERDLYRKDAEEPVKLLYRDMPQGHFGRSELEEAADTMRANLLWAHHYVPMLLDALDGRELPRRVRNQLDDMRAWLDRTQKATREYHETTERLRKFEAPEWREVK